MWPRTAPPTRATCRNPRLPPRAPCGSRSFSVTTQTNPLRCQTRRSIISFHHFDPTQQRRWITQKYLQRMQEGREEWARHAEEIKAGKRKNFAAHLEERGLIHDVVGYETILLSFVIRVQFTVGPKTDSCTRLTESANYCTKCSLRRELVSTAESTPRRLQCMSDICCLSWYWPGDMFGDYR
jgi:hypothetical protein